MVVCALQGKVLLCRVSVGRALDVAAETRPEFVMPPDGYDSVTGTSSLCGGTRMWALYDSAQVRVRFLADPRGECTACHE